MTVTIAVKIEIVKAKFYSYRTAGVEYPPVVKRQADEVDHNLQQQLVDLANSEIPEADRDRRARVDNHTCFDVTTSDGAKFGVCFTDGEVHIGKSVVKL